MSPITVGSLFSGIGGLELGLEWAGLGPVRWQVEADPWARGVLARHWPEAERFRDVREVSARDLSPVDLICGGFPCQDISSAGKRAGIGGSRSGLWGEFARIVGELRPRFVVVENVSALRVRGLGRVLGDLATLGYDAEWACFPASAVGALHRRDRIFIVAYTRRGGEQRRRGPGELEDSPGAREGQGPQRQWVRDAAIDCRPDVPNADRQVFGGDARQELAATRRCHRGRDTSGVWASEPQIRRMVDGFPGRVHRLRGLGNAVVPQVAEFIGRRILAAMAA